MPKTDQPKAQNPRYDAMKTLVNNRLNDTGTESGRSLREEMEDQGVEMVNLDAPIEADIKDSDSHSDQNKDVAVDITSDKFEPEDEGLKVDGVAEVEPIAVEDLEAEEDAKLVAAAAEATASESLDDSPVYQRDGKYYTKITVNGAEEEILFDTLTASAQKDKASFAKFQAAAAKEQDVAEREKRLRDAQAKQALDVRTQPAAAKEIGDTVDVDAEVDKLYDSLAYKDEETVKAELAEIVSRGASPQDAAGRDNVSTQSGQLLSDEDVEAKVNAAFERKATRDWEAGRQAAVDQWEIDYSDIAQDDELRGFANTESARIAKAFPQQAIQTTLAQAGDRARLWRDFQTGDKPTEKTPAEEIDTQSRLDKKRAAATPVQANGAAATRTVTEDKPQTRTDIVKEIRAGRGQAPV